MNKKQGLFTIFIIALGITIWGSIEALWHSIEIWKMILILGLAVIITGIIMIGGIVIAAGIVSLYEKLGDKTGN
jgi:hypothetical protein